MCYGTLIGGAPGSRPGFISPERLSLEELISCLSLEALYCLLCEFSAGVAEVSSCVGPRTVQMHCQRPCVVTPVASDLFNLLI